MTTPYRLDESQWTAVRAAGHHVLVAAGAGTGKTSTVVGRILYLLGVELQGERIAAPVGLEQLAAITFTNAAAADLKKKVRTALREAGRRADAAQVDTARIGTIHGFCGDLLREFALRANRGPLTTVLQDGESAILAGEAVREALIAAIEDRSVPGLDLLLQEQTLATVQDWVGRLLADSDRLRGYAARPAGHGPRERALLALALRALALLERRLDEESATDFDRMLVSARDLLRVPAIRQVVQRRIHTLIVDEFQDVDPVQKEIAFLLGEPGSGRPDTTRLLLVGDPKQSIYRFRRADVTVWTGVEREFAGSARGLVVPLAINYRSVPPLVRFVESVIGPILDRPLGEERQDFEVAFQATRPDRTEDEPADRAVELLLIGAEAGEKLNASGRRRREAAAIAARMLELRAAGSRWGDMAVLLGSWTDLAIYESALSAAGVPTYALAQSGFYARPEVVDILVALQAIRDPHDDVALFGFLRSPFVAVRDETLLHVAREARPPYWTGIATAVTGEQPLLQSGLALLTELALLRDRISTAELIERLLLESGYLAHLALLEGDGPQRIANVRKLLRMARGMVHAGVGEFIRMLREARDREDREGDARLYGESDDVVTLTSVHSAKGLQWKVVFWADLARGAGAGRSGGLQLGRDRLVVQDPELEDPPEWTAARDAADLEERAERKRVWYVAATRARDRLILSGIPADDKLPPKSPAEALWAGLGLRREGGHPTFGYGTGTQAFTGLVRVVRTTPAAAGEAGLAPIADATVALALPRERIPVPLGRARHSATEFLAHARCAVKHHFKYVAGVREPEVDRSGAEYSGAVIRGQIVHSVLERLEEEDELGLLLEDAIRRWDPEAPPPDTVDGSSYRDALQGEIAAVAGHPGYQAVATGHQARKELPFLHLIGREGFTQGVFDLAAPERAGMVLLDVKTSAIPASAAPERAAHYAPQRDVYLTAAEAIAGRPVERFAFQFSRAGVQVSEPITDPLRAEARRRSLAVMTGIGAGTPALTRFPMECHFCGYRRVGWCAGIDGGDAPSP